MDRRAKGLRILVLQNGDHAALPLDAPAREAIADVELMARSIAAALVQRGHQAEIALVEGASLFREFDRWIAHRPDLVFNLCESIDGDARHELLVPAMLELRSVPYTGSGPIALGAALRKDRTKTLLRAAGVPTPESVLLAAPDARACGLPFPLIVKPVHEDGSAGISSASVVRDPVALEAAVAHVIADFAQPAIVERYIEGRELYVSLLGNPPVPLPIHEIDFTLLPSGLPRIVGYDAKWKTDSVECIGTRPVRAVLDENVRRRVERAAVDAFRAVGLVDYGRVDIRLDRDNVPYVIDVNANCDLSDGAGFSRAAGYAGIDYPMLIERLCTIALERHHGRPEHERAVGPRSSDPGPLGAGEPPRSRRPVSPGGARLRARADRRRAR